MKKRIVSSSITKEKSRYNDDFGLNPIYTDAMPFKGTVIHNNFPEISSDTDFSISWEFVKSGTGVNSNQIFRNRAINLNAEYSGIYFAVTDFELNFQTHVNGDIASHIFTNVFTNFVVGSLIYCCINYNSTNSTFTLFVNSVQVGALTRTQTGNFKVTKGKCANFFITTSSTSNQSSTNTRNGRVILNSFRTYDRILTQSEITYLYQTNSISQSCASSIRSEYVFNKIAILENENSIRRTLNGTGGSTSGILFNVPFNVGDSIEATINDGWLPDSSTIRGEFGINLGTNISNILSSTKYRIFCEKSGVNYFYGTNSGVTATPYNLGDVVKITRSSANTLRYFVNNVLIVETTNPLINNNNFKVFVYNGFELHSFVKSVKRNGILLSEFEIQEIAGTDFNQDCYILDTVSNYNYAKTTPITDTDQKKCIFLRYTHEELGISAIPTFTAYSDFYTKVAGENLQKIGDSIYYKNKEIRKFGLQFNGTNQYLNVVNFAPTKEKGYTVLIGYAGNTNANWTAQQSLFSTTGSQGITRYKDYFLRGNGSKEVVASHQQVGFGIDQLTTQNYDQNMDVSKPFMFHSKQKGSRGVLIPYAVSGTNKATAIIGINSILVNYTTLEVYVGGTLTDIYGFEDITDGVTTIGARKRFNGSSYQTFAQGKILYLAVYKGILNDSEIKHYYNNGLFRTPDNLSHITKSELVLFPDFNNPYQNFTTLQIPDLSPFNHTITANGWATLSDLRHSRREIATGKAPSDWTPYEIDSVLWLDASDTSTISQSGGGAVSQWNDKSGTENHFVQTVGYARPITGIRTVNGLNVLDFDGIGHIMSLPDTANLQPAGLNSMVFAVIHSDKLNEEVIAQERIFCGQFGNTTRFGLLTISSTTTLNFAQSSTSFSPVSITRQSGLKLISGYKNGTEIGISYDGGNTSNTNNLGETAPILNGFFIGGQFASGVFSNYFDGAIAEIIVTFEYDNIIKQKIEGYLAWKWGTVASLPITHPYKNNPPIIQ